MIEVAVETQSELLAAASPCRQSSWQAGSPWHLCRAQGRRWPGGQDRRVPAVGCCRDHGEVPRFVVLGGSCRTTALSLILRPETPVWLQQKEARSCRAGAGDNFFPLQRARGGGCNGTALPCLPPQPAGTGAPTHSPHEQPTPLLAPDAPGSADKTSKANFRTGETPGSFLAAETPCPRLVRLSLPCRQG